MPTRSWLAADLKNAAKGFARWSASSTDVPMPVKLSCQTPLREGREKRCLCGYLGYNSPGHVLGRTTATPTIAPFSLATRRLRLPRFFLSATAPCLRAIGTCSTVGCIS